MTAVMRSAAPRAGDGSFPPPCHPPTGLLATLRWAFPSLPIASRWPYDARHMRRFRPRNTRSGLI